MMRALLFLSIVGAIIYGFLVITGNALSGENTKDGLTIQAKPDHSADDRLSSWDSYLPSRSQSRNPQLASSQQPAALPSQTNPSQDSEVYRLALTASKNREGASDDSLESESPVVAPAPAQVAAESTPLSAPSFVSRIGHRRAIDVQRAPTEADARKDRTKVASAALASAPSQRFPGCSLII